MNREQVYNIVKSHSDNIIGSMVCSGNLLMEGRRRVDIDIKSTSDIDMIKDDVYGSFCINFIFKNCGELCNFLNEVLFEKVSIGHLYIEDEFYSVRCYRVLILINIVE